MRKLVGVWSFAIQYDGYPLMGTCCGVDSLATAGGELVTAGDELAVAGDALAVAGDELAMADDELAVADDALATAGGELGIAGEKPAPGDVLASRSSALRFCGRDMRWFFGRLDFTGVFINFVFSGNRKNPEIEKFPK
jgi:hypothetical protein